MVRSLEEYKLNAEPAAQLRLLDLQAVDSKLDQLAYAKAHSPEAVALATSDAQIGTLADTVIAAATLVSDLEREQAKADADVDLVRERAKKDRELMDSGTIGSAKQLESLAHELESLAKRQADLEEVELEVMERLEGALKAHAQLAAELEQLEAVRIEQRSAVEVTFANIDADAANARVEREAISQELPADLVKLYEKVRADHGEIGRAHV